MKESIFFRGRHDIIVSSQFKLEADNLSDFVSNYFRSKADVVKMVDTVPRYTLAEKVTQDTTYVIGHSQGANRILVGLGQQRHPFEAVILFDPVPTWFYADIWNAIIVPKLLFASDWGKNTVMGDDYDIFGRVIKINDDHFFNKSFDVVASYMDKFFMDLVPENAQSNSQK